MSKKTSRKRNAAILLIVVVFAALAVIGLYQNMSSSRPLTAQEYFEVTAAGIISGSIPENNTYLVTAITVTFKPIRGDAHEVVVQSWANSDPQDVGDLKKDAVFTVSLYSQYGVVLKRQPQGFLTSIRITSWEASGEVKFYLSE